MSLHHLLNMVDEFGRQMNNNGKHPGSIAPAALNRSRERLHEAIKALAEGKLDETMAAWYAADSAITVATAPTPIPPPPVNLNSVTLTDGSPVTPDHREINPATGQQKGYVVLSADERAKGFVRPYRDAYKHDTCGTVTTMGRSLSETYARDPKFYSGTFCVKCRVHRPLAEFRWYEMDGTIGPVVGT